MCELPNCVPEYFREQQERYDRECELALQREEYYQENRAYRERKREEGYAELDFYPDDCRKCQYGCEAPPRDADDDIPTMICGNWWSCKIFRQQMEEAFPNESWDEIKSWFKEV